MKILYIGNDSHGAELTAFALRSTVPGVAVAWIPSLKAARGWIEENQDVAVLAVEVNPDPAACALFISQIRGLGVTAPLVLVAGGLGQPAPPALEAVAEAVLPLNASLPRDLPATIGRLLKGRPSQASPEASPALAVRSAPSLPAKAPAESPQSNPFAHLVQAPDAVEHQLKQALAMLEQAHQDRQALAAVNVDVERRLADATAAFERAESRHAAEMHSATARLGDERARAKQQAAQAGVALDALRAELVAQAAALHQAEQEAAVDRHATAEDAARRQAQAESDLARETSARQAAERAVAAAESDAIERSAQAAAALDALQAKLTEATDALQRAGQQAEADRQASAAAAATRQAAFDAERNQLEASQGALRTALADADARLRHAEERHRSESAAAAARLAESEQQAAAALDALRAELVEQAAALHKAEQQAAVDRRAAAEEGARRQAQAESDLARETSARQAAERAVAANEAARAAAEQRHAAELAAIAARLADQEQLAAQRLADAAARLDEQQREASERSARASAALDALQARLVEATARHTALSTELADADARLADTAATAEHRSTQDAEALEALRSELAHAAAQASSDRQAAIEAAAAHQAVIERQTAELARSAARLEEIQRQAEAQLAQAAADAKEREAGLEARLREEVARRETSESELVQARAAAEQAQRRFLDASNEMRERAREHALHLEERTARERAEWEATLAERQERIAQLQRDGDLLRQSLASTEGHLKRLQTTHDEQRARFDRARDAADADLARVRNEYAALQATLEDHRRQFDAAPVSLCRCAPDGTVTQATRALAHLLGYASSEQIVSGGVGVFDAGDELQWLIDRCLSSRSTQSIETTWRKKDGSRIVVRIVAAATSAGCVDLAAEDITTVRALEEKLRHAQRLEAVARYASEVAGTCENLLRDVEHAGPQWLSLIENPSARQQGERLLADVIRVSGFLRQLAEYGGKQKQALPLVDVNSVLRDLASVLKRVAGDHIELVLPKGSKPLNLDVETEHVERIFVNIAAYARARMPLGGRLLIDVAPALIDRQFTEKYPSVRPGAHVLFTVTEVKGPASSPAAGLPGSAGPNGHDKPGVDLGMLQSLVSNCGGHLWIAAEPSGDMILKIHLPRRALDDRAATSGAARWISRLAAVTRH
ncbi:MAG TPA: hypothetical protein VLT86_10875 [Vicinamibacterales bacterium]|nr:hypothetical protein [Vicinamibacterales bacterium]